MFGVLNKKDDQEPKVQDVTLRPGRKWGGMRKCPAGTWDDGNWCRPVSVKGEGVKMSKNKADVKLMRVHIFFL